jgi:hypothetical protein
VLVKSNGSKHTVRECLLKIQVNKSIYPHVMIGGKMYKIHALVAAAFIGPRPPGLEVMHANDIPTDNRVENLSYGSRAENIATMTARRTHCPQGHEYSPENTKVYRNSRFCRTCARKYQRDLRQRRKQELEGRVA